MLKASERYALTIMDAIGYSNTVANLVVQGMTDLSLVSWGRTPTLPRLEHTEFVELLMSKCR